jgi:hypothetical protein
MGNLSAQRSRRRGRGAARSSRPRTEDAWATRNRLRKPADGEEGAGSVAEANEASDANDANDANDNRAVRP